ncbi:MAG TPA: DUF4440 domain-containing protein [Gaiellaceae bacterium]|jgi:ketosteroid isomerase-like protein
MPLSDDDLAEIHEAEQALEDALNDPDRTAWVDHYTDDAVFIGHNRPTLVGRDALLAYSAQMPAVSSLRIEALDVDGSRDHANVTGELGGVSARVRSLLVWRREPDGRWRVAREMLNTE